MNKIKIEIKWAVIFSIITLLWMFLEKISGLHSQFIEYHMFLTNLFAIPAIIMMVMALNDKKRNSYGGIISYKQGFISGIIISVFIALLSPFTQWIIAFKISPEYFPNIIKYSVELGHFSSTIEAEAYFNYESYAMQAAIGALVMGILTSAIAMIFIRTKDTSS